MADDNNNAFDTTGLKWALGGVAGAGLLGGLLGGSFSGSSGGVSSQRELVDMLRSQLEFERGQKFSVSSPTSRSVLERLRASQEQQEENVMNVAAKRGLRDTSSTLEQLRMGGLETEGQALSNLASQFEQKQSQEIMNLVNQLTSAQSVLNQLIQQEEMEEQEGRRALWQSIGSLGTSAIVGLVGGK